MTKARSTTDRRARARRGVFATTGALLALAAPAHAGDGTFAAATSASVGSFPSSVAVADLNNDGNQDLVSANFSSPGSVSVLLANGASPSLGNLLANPGAEGAGAAGTPLATPAFRGWTSSTAGAATVVRYASPGFAGGTGPSASAEQTVSVADRAASIDGGVARATLSGLLGGSGAQSDAAGLSATFLGATSAPLGSPLTIGPLSAADRKNQTILLRRSANAPIPAGTRSIRVSMNMTGTGLYNEASLDDLSLRVSAPAPPPPPGLGADLTPLCKGKRATIVATKKITRGTTKADVIVGRSGPDVIGALGGNDIVCGRGGADTLLGQAGPDTLIGGAGRDLLRGGAGKDLLRGGLGLDRLRGGPGLDRQLQ